MNTISKKACQIKIGDIIVFDNIPGKTYLSSLGNYVMDVTTDGKLIFIVISGYDEDLEVVFDANDIVEVEA